MEDCMLILLVSIVLGANVILKGTCDGYILASKIYTTAIADERIKSVLACNKST